MNLMVQFVREIECLLNDNHQKGKMMIMIMKTSGSQVDSPARFTSRPEARGSGPEAVFRYLGSGVDSRGEKGEKGQRVGSSSREFAYV